MTALYRVTFRGIAFLMFVLGLFLTMNRGVFAADLKPTATVGDAVIRLSDLVTGTFDDEAQGRLVIATAPAPGQRSVIAVQDIANIAYKRGIALTNSGNISRVVVERTGTAIPRAVIEASLDDEMHAAGFTGDFEIRLPGQDVSLSVPQGAPFDIAVAGFQYDPRSHRFQASLTAGPGTDYATSVQVYGIAVPVVKVPVLTARLQKSDIIKKADLDWVNLPQERVTDGMVTDVADLIGMSPKRTLQAGQPIRQRDIGQPLMIEKGALVTMQLMSPGLSLSAAGRAIEDGSMGDVVRIINADTHQTVSAEVIGPNQVRVGLRHDVVADIR
jgi:flagella basal body P-ring formation protein FlgA